MEGSRPLQRSRPWKIEVCIVSLSLSHTLLLIRSKLLLLLLLLCVVVHVY